MTNTITANTEIKKETNRFVKGLGVLKYGLAAFLALAGRKTKLSYALLCIMFIL